MKETLNKNKSKENSEDVCINIDELKQFYIDYKEKYNLPEFSELNKTFDIEDIDIDT